jgi:cobalt-precorrin-5B (C1)-methyltransferase
MEIIAAHCALAGAGLGVIRQIMECATTEAAVGIIEELGLTKPVWESIGQKIGFHLRERTHGGVAIEYIVFTQEHGILCRGLTTSVAEG